LALDMAPNGTTRITADRQTDGQQKYGSIKNLSNVCCSTQKKTGFAFKIDK